MARDDPGTEMVKGNLNLMFKALKKKLWIPCINKINFKESKIE